MAENSSIQWTDATWNPVTGCDKVSPGCGHCYAERFSLRLKAMGNPRYANGTKVTVHWDLLEAPLRWTRPRLIFVNSMSDLFHPNVPIDFIRAVLATAEGASWHTFQVLTKRSRRLRELSGKLRWPANVWVGVSVENQLYDWRVDDLRAVPAAVRFLSMEPLLGPISELNLDGIDWVIVGGESGPGARRLEPEWVRVVRDQCVRRGIPFFFKQWGGVRRKTAGRLLDGRIWSGMPPREGVRPGDPSTSELGSELGGHHGGQQGTPSNDSRRSSPRP